MDTMTYASFGAFRRRVADRSNKLGQAEAEFIPLDLSQIKVPEPVANPR
jgi:hypothetical protein